MNTFFLDVLNGIIVILCYGYISGVFSKMLNLIRKHPPPCEMRFSLFHFFIASITRYDAISLNLASPMVNWELWDYSSPQPRRVQPLETPPYHSVTPFSHFHVGFLTVAPLLWIMGKLTARKALLLTVVKSRFLTVAPLPGLWITM